MTLSYGGGDKEEEDTVDLLGGHIVRKPCACLAFIERIKNIYIAELGMFADIHFYSLFSAATPVT